MIVIMVMIMITRRELNHSDGSGDAWLMPSAARAGACSASHAAQRWWDVGGLGFPTLTPHSTTPPPPPQPISSVQFSSSIEHTGRVHTRAMPTLSPRPPRSTRVDRRGATAQHGPSHPGLRGWDTESGTEEHRTWRMCPCPC